LNSPAGRGYYVAENWLDPKHIICECRRVYARVARKLKVSASLVSKVADGHRTSREIEAALLHEELKALKGKLNKYL
jgi:hypothetical protein